MRTLRLFLYIAASSLIFLACNNDDEMLTLGTTHPAEIHLSGDAEVFIVQGQTYEDPGVDSVVNGTLKNVVNDVNPQLPGSYVVKYVAENEDGISFVSTRRVIVLAEGDDPGVEVEGTYEGLENDTYRNDVVIEKVAIGVYKVQDFLVGRYARNPNNYGSGYEYSGLMRYKDGEFVFPLPLTAGFGPLKLSDFKHNFDDPITFSFGAELVDHGFNFGGAEFKLVKK